jgi:hypothetical protein
MIVVFQIREEFRGVANCSKRLATEWFKYKPLVLELAATNKHCQDLLATIQDDMDEGILYL